MKLSTDQLSRMSRLLEDAIDLDATQRKMWLEALASEDQDLKEALRHGLLGPGEAGADPLSLPVCACLPDDATGLKVGDRVGPYLLTRELGHGGMARVWLAARVDGAVKREVALKIPWVGTPRQGLAHRFALERDILARLEHPNIARLYDAGATQQGVPYLALEFVAGKSLLAWADERRLGIRERIELFLQVLGAVQYAHECGVLHRDLKPSNVLVTDSGQVRLLDFGVAKLLQPQSESGLTRVYGRAFTPEYASPEHIQGDPLLPGSDVYSLGVMLYELLVGSRPHRIKATDSARLLEKAANRPPADRPSTRLGPEAGTTRATPQKTLARQLRGDLDAIVLKALAAVPDERYGSAAALADDLRRHLKGEPVTARPAYLSYRFTRFIRRHRTGVANTAAAVAVAAVAGSYLSSTVTERTPPVSAALGDRPIAVLPFVALPTGDGSTAQGVSFARDVSVALARTLANFAWRTIAVPDVEIQTDPAEIQRLGRKLNVNYLVSGNFRHADDQIRVDMQIMDANTGTQIWADRVETPEAKAARFPDLVLLRTTAVLRRAIYKVTADRIAGTPPQGLNPSEMVILADETEDQDAKVRLYLEAMHRDPDLVPALVGWADRLRSLEASVAENERNLQQADDLSMRAIRLAPNDADAWYVRGWILWHQDRYDAAITANAKAIDLDPSYAKSYVARGLYTISIGQPEAALPALDRARDIDSTVDGIASRTACRAFLSMGRYDEAVQNCERAMATDESVFAHVYLTAAYAQKGDMARAAESRARLLQLRPSLTLETLRGHSNKSDAKRFREQWDKHVIAGLRTAGIPER